MSEAPINKEVLVESSKKGWRLFRNNTAKAWAGKIFRSQMPCSVRLNPEDVVVRNAYPISAGLCVGSSDNIGWRPVLITQEMVGTTIAQFTAIEVKYGSTATTKEQHNFVDQVNKAGGYAKIIRSASEL